MKYQVYLLLAIYSGLGLSLCRSIALAHGGSIEVAAADPHGSVFTIELPAADVSFDKE